MTYRVSAGEKRPTHHVLLTDNTEVSDNEAGLIVCTPDGTPNLTQGLVRGAVPPTSLKMSQTEPSYGDLEPPFREEEQKDWAGGAGREDLVEGDRFYDSYMVNTMHEGKIFLAPQPQMTGGLLHEHKYRHLQGTYFQDLIDDSYAVRVDIVPPSNVTVENIYFWFRHEEPDSDPGDIHFRLYDNAWSLIASHNITTQPDPPLTRMAELLPFYMGVGGEALTGGQTYHILIATTGSSYSNSWQVGYDQVGQPGASDSWTTATDNPLSDPANNSYASTGDILYFLEDINAKDQEALLFKLSGQEFHVANYDDGTTPQLFINGDRGIATGYVSATKTLTDAAKAWVIDEHIGKIYRIIEGKGKGNWAEIIDNTATTLVLDQDVDADATSVYIIINDDGWTEITGHGITEKVTHVFVSTKEQVYFCQGDGTDMRRMRYNAATPAWEFAGEGNDAVFIDEYTEIEEKKAKQYVYRIRNEGTNGEVTFSKDGIKDWTPFTWTVDTPIGKKHEIATGLERYGSPERPWVMKEGSIWEIVDDIPQRIPLREMETVMSSFHGKAHLVHNLYLYLNMFDGGVERYYQQHLDDMGMNRDDGLPDHLVGPVSFMIGEPGRMWAAIDGTARGVNNKSSIWVQNGRGWSCIHESFFAGEAITRMDIQTIPGDNLDRVWISCGTHVYWLPLPSHTRTPVKDPNYKFFFQGSITLSRRYFGFRDLMKYWHKMKFFWENHDGDGSPTWSHAKINFRYLSEAYDASGRQWVDMVNTLTGTNTWTQLNEHVSAKTETKIRDAKDLTVPIISESLTMRLYLWAVTDSCTPIIKAIIWSGLTFRPHNFHWDATFQAYDDNLDLQDDPDDITSAVTLVQRLDDWSTQGKILVMRSVDPLADDKEVFIEPASVRLIELISDDDGKVKYLAGARVRQIEA